MKAPIKNQIKLAIVAVCVLLIGSSFAVAEETLLLASLSRTTPLEDFEDFDRWPWTPSSRQFVSPVKV